MRVILFRGKRVDNGERVEGGYDVHGDHILTKALDDWGEDYYGTYKVIPETVVQYTGLEDMNGTRVFEGDILKFEGDDREMIIPNWLEWNCGCCSNVYGWDTDYRKPMDGIVIGNIHDKERG